MQSKDLMFSISKNPQAGIAEVLAKQRSISTVKNPSYPSNEALLLERRRAGVTRNGNEAPRGRKTGTNPRGGIEKIESDP